MFVPAVRNPDAGFERRDLARRAARPFREHDQRMPGRRQQLPAQVEALARILFAIERHRVHGHGEERDLRHGGEEVVLRRRGIRLLDLAQRQRGQQADGIQMARRDSRPSRTARSPGRCSRPRIVEAVIDPQPRAHDRMQHERATRTRTCPAGAETCAASRAATCRSPRSAGSRQSLTASP